MPVTDPVLPTLDDFLAGPLRVGKPDVHGPLAVFALFGPPPVLDYVVFADGVARGLLVKELHGGASAGDLVVLNPADVDVLLYEGEEVLGAPQNRTFDVSVLVAAGRSLRVPVLAAIGGRLTALDHVNRPDAFATLPGPLVRGCPRSVEVAATASPAPSPSEANAFVASLAGARETQHSTTGSASAGTPASRRRSRPAPGSSRARSSSSSRRSQSRVRAARALRRRFAGPGCGGRRGGGDAAGAAAVRPAPRRDGGWRPARDAASRPRRSRTASARGCRAGARRSTDARPSVGRILPSCTAQSGPRSTVRPRATRRDRAGVAGARPQRRGRRSFGEDSVGHTERIRHERR